MSQGCWHRGDRHIRAIERHGRREWYKLSGYTKRSMVENAVYRYKAIIGPEMRARTLARQRVEHRIGCEILNKMAALGMPDTRPLRDPRLHVFVALLHGPEQIADLPVPVAESPGAVRAAAVNCTFVADENCTLGTP